MFDIFTKDRLYEICLGMCKNSTLIEMAINRSELEKSVQEQTLHILKHYVKIHALPEHTAKDHWIGEIKGAFAKFSDVRYRHNNKRPKLEQWISHVHNNALPELGEGTIRQIHSDLTDDEDYSGVKEIHVPSVKQGFDDLLNRCFGKISQGNPVTRKDIY